MNNWDRKVATPVVKKAKECTNCAGRGIETSEFDDMFENTIRVVHDCVPCNGTGLIITEYKQCGCGKSVWMEKGSTRCKDCFHAELDKYMREIGLLATN